jgi:hypothetical protein
MEVVLLILIFWLLAAIAMNMPRQPQVEAYVLPREDRFSYRLRREIRYAIFGDWEPKPRQPREPSRLRKWYRTSQAPVWFWVFVILAGMIAGMTAPLWIG